eukprot:7733006-Ditylum_brightwellii.AAC.1
MALAVYLLRSHSRIAQELMLHVALHDGGITEELLDTKFDGMTLRNKFDLPGVVSAITPTVFTTKKGLWQIETTKDQ